ncbi:MAG TPA: helix-hairpin-helix domain-containing protein [Kofleriaceae bacterium]|nr:helix-hairpin-helix domain-containing protein [Kofleriaceae bacterium]
MTALPLIDVIGAWLGIFLTFCILSFLYKDNPFYKFAEHLFVGVSIGYVVTLQYQDTIEPTLISHLTDQWWKIFPLILVALMLVKAMSRRYAWLGRFPLAFAVALYAGLAINAVAQSELGAQINFAMHDLDARKVDLNTADAKTLGGVPGMSPAIAKKLIAEREGHAFSSVDDAVSRASLTPAEQADLAEKRGGLVGLDAKASVTPGEKDWFGIASNVLLLLGLLASLLYFYFSLAHKGVVGRVSRFGVWILMIGFGASFGYTVQGRIALAIGRALDIQGKTVAPEDAAAVHGPWAALISAVIIVGGIAFWELRARKKVTE